MTVPWNAAAPASTRTPAEPLVTTVPTTSRVAASTATFPAAVTAASKSTSSPATVRSAADATAPPKCASPSAVTAIPPPLAVATGPPNVTFSPARSIPPAPVVDTAPAFDEQTLTTLEDADECVIIATLDVPTLKNVKVALDTLEMLNIGRGHRHLLLNRADDEVGLGADRVESILGMEITGRLGSSMEVAAATNAGRPIMSENPQHPSSQALREVATRLTGAPVAPDAAPPGGPSHQAHLDKKSGLFRRKK